MALWGRHAGVALWLWGPGGGRGGARGGWHPCGCRPAFTGTEGVSAGAVGLGLARTENRTAACQTPLSADAVATALRTRPRASVPRLFLRSIAGGRRPISFSVGALSIFGSRGNSEKGNLSLQDIADLIRARACQRVVVMVGAGISTPSGIPDFRSPGSGLYSNLQKYNIPYPEAIFELAFFFHNPKPFFTLAKELYPGNYRPNVTHYFLRLLHDKGLLLRLYTQNIDGLERVSGIPASKLVEAHGTFASATCTVCRTPFPGEAFWADVMADRVPQCSVCTGIVKPDIVFYGEPLPERFLLHVVDFPMADLLLILGTSLEVEPFASLSEAVRSSVPRLLINRDLVGPLAWRPRSRDVAQLGDVVHGVERLVELLGWTEEMQDLVQRETGKLNGRDR